MDRQVDQRVRTLQNRSDHPGGYWTEELFKLLTRMWDLEGQTQLVDEMGRWSYRDADYKWHQTRGTAADALEANSTTIRRLIDHLQQAIPRAVTSSDLGDHYAQVAEELGEAELDEFSD
jgi:hypothetical protein